MGSGKSFFVRRWAERLRQAGHPVVEFNAWENDSESDPLVPFVAECSEALKGHFTEDQNAMQSFKEKGGRIALQLGGIATKAVLRKALGSDGVKDVCNLFSKETEADLIKLGGNLVQEQVKKKLEREAFTAELEALVKHLENAKMKLPVFIFIDELDRCRPTFSIELLERVKHLFHVDRIKFIFSTDTEQLSHSINGVYGVGFDAKTYLQRFFDETFTLPAPDSTSFAVQLFKDLREEFEDLDILWISANSVELTFSALARDFGLTLRQQERAASRLISVSRNIHYDRDKPFHFLYACALIMLRLRNDDRYMELTRKDGKIRKATIMKAVTKEFLLEKPYRKALDLYAQLADKTHDESMNILNSPANRFFDDQGMGRYAVNLRHSGSREEEGWLESRILKATVLNFSNFKRYSKFIELSEALS